MDLQMIRECNKNKTLLLSFKKVKVCNKDSLMCYRIDKKW
jgi:hypothetical protein